VCNHLTAQNGLLHAIKKFSRYHLHSPRNMVAQANKTGTSKNTSNEKKTMTVPGIEMKVQ